jgi:hypothetical protein
LVVVAEVVLTTAADTAMAASAAVEVVQFIMLVLILTDPVLDMLVKVADNL